MINASADGAGGGQIGDGLMDRGEELFGLVDGLLRGPDGQRGLGTVTTRRSFRHGRCRDHARADGGGIGEGRTGLGQRCLGEGQPLAGLVDIAGHRGNRRAGVPGRQLLPGRLGGRNRGLERNPAPVHVVGHLGGAALEVTQAVELLGLRVETGVGGPAVFDDLRQRLAADLQVGCRFLVEGHPQPERLGDVLAGGVEGGAEPGGRLGAVLRGGQLQLAFAGAQVVVQLDEQGIRLGGQLLERRAGGLGRRLTGAGLRRLRPPASAPDEHPDQRADDDHGEDHQYQGQAATTRAGRRLAISVRSGDDRAGPVVAGQRRLDVVLGDPGELAVGETGVVGERVGVRPVTGGHGEQGVAVAEVTEPGGLVGPVLGGHAVERVDEDDEQLDAGIGLQAAKCRVHRGPSAAENARLVGHLGGEAPGGVGAGRRRCQQDGDRGQHHDQRAPDGEGGTGSRSHTHTVDRWRVSCATPVDERPGGGCPQDRDVAGGRRSRG